MSQVETMSYTNNIIINISNIIIFYLYNNILAVVKIPTVKNKS